MANSIGQSEYAEKPMNESYMAHQDITDNTSFENANPIMTARDKHNESADGDHKRS